MQHGLNIPQSSPKGNGPDSGESEFEYALKCLRKVEANVHVEIADLERRMTELSVRYETRDDELHDELERCMNSLESLRGSVGDLTSAIVRHIESDSNRLSRQSLQDRERDAMVAKLTAEFGHLAAQTGHRSGAAAGRQSAKRWSALWSAVGLALSMIATAALQRCTNDLAGQKPVTTPQVQTHGGP